MQGDHSKLEAERERLLKTAARIVVKLGTSTVTAPDGTLCFERVAPLMQSVARLHAAGKQIVLVSSGAIGLGRGWLGLHRARLEDLATKQACAAVGQSLLMNAYKEMFSSWNIKVAQVLLTGEDFSNWGRYIKLRRTMEKLLNLKVLPIVNENDTVSTAEIESLDGESRTAAFSDNDRLAALVMSGLDGDVLILLTNVDGTKPDILECIFAGEPVGTAFVQAQRIRGKRRWIAYAAGVRGRVTVDAGARRAITQGKASLLTSGVERVDGTFSPMDVVSIVDSDGQEIARGIVTCASNKAEEMVKKKNTASGKRRQASSPHILVKRDNIVLLEQP